MHSSRIAFAFVAFAMLFPFSASAETIHSYNSALILNADGSMSVSETIDYDFGPNERNGIFRDIPLTFNAEGVQERGIEISNVTATDNTGAPYQFETSESDGKYHIKIGDRHVLIKGDKTYVISYEVRGIVVPLSDGDEIYWNATGNSWPVPIEKTAVDISLRPAAPVISSSCYQGSIGSTETCNAASNTDTVHFESTRPLNPGEGMTVATAFAKGTVPIIPLEPQGSFDLSKTMESMILSPGRFFIAIGSALVSSVPSMAFTVSGILIALGGIFFALRTWWLHGKDPKGKGTIIPYYESPKGISAMEAAMIVRQKIIGRDITAELISLAIQGSLKIAQETSKILRIFNSTDYRLIQTGGQTVLAKEHDRNLYGAVFYAASEDSGVRSILLSDIDKQYFQSQLQGMKDSVRDEVIQQGLYDGGSKWHATMLGISGGVSIFVSFLGFIFELDSTTDPAIGVFLLGLAIAGVAMFIAAYFMDRVTPEGALVREQLLGLKEYLQIAEKDRLAFHNAPDKRSEVFEALLPYAIMFAVEKEWAKEFEGVSMPPPQWYSGNTAAFSAGAFASDLNSFSGSFTSAIAVSASGSGDGGSSGGGGGGGGGGSW